MTRERNFLEEINYLGPNPSSSGDDVTTVDNSGTDASKSSHSGTDPNPEDNSDSSYDPESSSSSHQNQQQWHTVRRCGHSLEGTPVFVVRMLLGVDGLSVAIAKPNFLVLLGDSQGGGGGGSCQTPPSSPNTSMHPHPKGSLGHDLRSAPTRQHHFLTMILEVPRWPDKDPQTAVLMSTCTPPHLPQDTPCLCQGLHWAPFKCEPKAQGPSLHWGECLVLLCLVSPRSLSLTMEGGSSDPRGLTNGCQTARWSTVSAPLQKALAFADAPRSRAVNIATIICGFSHKHYPWNL